MARENTPDQSKCHAGFNAANTCSKTLKRMQIRLARIKRVLDLKTLGVHHVHACSSAQEHFRPEIHKNHTIGIIFQRTTWIKAWFNLIRPRFKDSNGLSFAHQTSNHYNYFITP